MSEQLIGAPVQVFLGVSTTPVAGQIVEVNRQEPDNVRVVYFRPFSHGARTEIPNTWFSLNPSAHRNRVHIWCKEEGCARQTVSLPEEPNPADVEPSPDVEKTPASDTPPTNDDSLAQEELFPESG